MARAHARRIMASEDDERRALVIQLFNESQTTGWAFMLLEKYVQPHMTSEVVAYATEQCLRDTSKRRMVAQPVKSMTQEDTLVKRGISYDRIFAMLPSLTLIQKGDYYKYMATT